MGESQFNPPLINYARESGGFQGGSLRHQIICEDNQKIACKVINQFNN